MSTVHDGCGPHPERETARKLIEGLRSRRWFTGEQRPEKQDEDFKQGQDDRQVQEERR